MVIAKILPIPLFVAVAILSSLPQLHAQRQVRVWFVDKGRPDGVIRQSDGDYQVATAHLSERALRRRAKVLPENGTVTTRDLPVHSVYLDGLGDIGVRLLQTSRWFNTALVEADSQQVRAILDLPAVDSVTLLSDWAVPAGKRAGTSKRLLFGSAPSGGSVRNIAGECLTEHYGLSAYQLTALGVDAVHNAGFFGDGAFVGVIDAGFDTSHSVFDHLHVVAMHDFVEDDGDPADPPGQFGSESHGTLVLSVLAGLDTGRVVGVAPSASVALAKTEDVRSETPVEEDNLVAALEWLEGLGVDITNTSLGYTTFDAPYHDHGSDLDGKTAFASRGINEAARLGVISIVSAGNDFRTFRRVAVPGEAESAIAVAAIDSTGNVAPFSSQGTGNPDRVKPDIAAPGVRIIGSNAANNGEPRFTQGTSLAAPLVTGIAALLRAADTSATPGVIREALIRSAPNMMADTLVGHGLASASTGFNVLSGGELLIGRPRMVCEGPQLLSLIVGMWSSDVGSPIPFSSPYMIRTTVLSENAGMARTVTHEVSAVGTQILPISVVNAGWAAFANLDSLSIRFEGEVLRERAFTLVPRTETGLTDGPCLRFGVATDDPSIHVAPVPTLGPQRISILLPVESTLSIALFNTIGERVATVLPETTRGPGVVYGDIDIGHLEPGAYYYRLLVDGRVYSRPLILR